MFLSLWDRSKILQGLMISVLLTFGIISSNVIFVYAVSSLSITPSSGLPGTIVTINGSSGFTPSSNYTVWLDVNNDTIPSGTDPFYNVTTTAAGTLPPGLTFTIPTNAYVPGNLIMYISADGPDANQIRDASIPFTVLKSSLSITPSSGLPGTIVTVNGSKLALSANYTIWLEVNGDAVPSSNPSGIDPFYNVTTTATGSVPPGLTFTIPISLSPGSIIHINADGPDTNQLSDASAPFIVSSPSLSITPSSGLPGTIVTINGSSGFTPSSNYTVWLDVNGDAIPSANPAGTDPFYNVTTTATGTLPPGLTFVIPIDSHPSGGPIAIHADGPDTNQLTDANTSFTTSKQSISITPSSGLPGTIVTVNGSKLALSANYTVWLDITKDNIPSGIDPFYNVTTTATGSVPPGLTFTIPISSSPGPIYIRADGPGNNVPYGASTPFTVTSETVILLQDSYSTNSTWTQIGHVKVDNHAYPGVLKFDNAPGGGGVDQHRAYRQIPSTLPSNNWSINFEYKPTSSSLVAHYPLALTNSSENPDSLSNVLRIYHGVTTNQLRISYVNGSSLPIPISLNTLYHVTLDRNQTQLKLSIFSDSQRTMHIAGSPVSVNIQSTDYNNLNFVQHSSSLLAGPARVLTATIDNLLITTSMSTPVTSSPSSQTVNSSIGVLNFTANSGGFTSITEISESSLPLSGKPSISFPLGFYNFTVNNITPNSFVVITVNYPNAIPAGSQYWKVINGVWVNATSALGSNDGDDLVTLTIQDNGPFDIDPTPGTITDPGGPGIRNLYCNNMTIEELAASGIYNLINNTSGVYGLKVRGTVGNDLILLSDLGNHVQGKDGDDCIIGGSARDVMSGGLGNDQMYGGEGNDHMTGRDGSDSMFGGYGNDRMSGGVGNDIVSGDVGDDVVLGREDDDTLSGGIGNDYCSGEAGADTADTSCESSLP